MQVEKSDEFEVCVRHYCLYPGLHRDRDGYESGPGRAVPRRKASRSLSEDSANSDNAGARAVRAWRAWASALVLASLLGQKPLAEPGELLLNWAARAAGRTFAEGVACLLRLARFRCSPASLSWNLGRFKTATYEVVSQNTPAQAEKRRERHGGVHLCHAGSPAQARRQAPLAAAAFAECMGPDPGEALLGRRVLYPNQKCLVLLARCGGLTCTDIPGGREAIVSHLRRLLRRDRRLHDIQHVELALIDHFQIDISDLEEEIRDLVGTLVERISSGVTDWQEGGTQPRLLIAFLKRKPPSWWALPSAQIEAVLRVLCQRKDFRPLAEELSAWAAPASLNPEELLATIQAGCSVRNGPSLAQVLAGIRHWGPTVEDLEGGGATVLKCVQSLLRRPRAAFAAAVSIFSHFGLGGDSLLLSRFEADALVALAVLSGSDRRALEAALQALAAEPLLLGAKTTAKSAAGPMHWPAWVSHSTSCKGLLPALQLDVPFRVVSTALELETSLATLDAAGLLGLDAEWVPGTAGAAILQLATYSEVHIWDLQELGMDLAAPALRRVLGSRRTRKLGFGFALSDWQRLAPWALEARAVVDLDILWMRIQPEEPLMGLKSLVAKTLAHRLDKTEQCSDWAARPLSLSQLQYAALDAHCLLQVWKVLSPSSKDVAAVVADLSAVQSDVQCQSHACGFAGVEVRVGAVDATWPISGSRHLTCCRVSMGPAGHRQVVQGYMLEPGQRVLVLCNLPPREMHGVMSQGGLLVASYADGQRVAVMPPASALLGDLLRESGERWPAIDLDAAENAWDRCSARLSTEAGGTVLVDGRPLMLAGEACTVSGGAGGNFT
ncbi:unnamed protein product [Polarella glacialis]|uniref:tRNA-binding domain-containing protein n=1 Tax=Polarella glacialis TaxID=89957 RepID=A0A813LG30_POLGL|nr:unnamed protein product [Polarella glacialis]